MQQGRNATSHFCSRFNCRPSPVTDFLPSCDSLHIYYHWVSHTKQIVDTCVLYTTFKLFITYLIPPWHLTPCGFMLFGVFVEVPVKESHSLIYRFTDLRMTSTMPCFGQHPWQRLARVLSLLVSGNSLGTTGRPPIR